MDVGKSQGGDTITYATYSLECISKVKTGVNLFENIDFTAQYISSLNTVTPADYNNLLSDYIPVNEGEIYEFKLNHNTTTACDWLGYAWYTDRDENSIYGKRYTVWWYDNYDGFTYCITVPSGAKYLRIGARHMDVGKVQNGDKVTYATYYLKKVISVSKELCAQWKSSE